MRAKGLHLVAPELTKAILVNVVLARQNLLVNCQLAKNWFGDIIKKNNRKVVRDWKKS